MLASLDFAYRLEAKASTNVRRPLMRKAVVRCSDFQRQVSCLIDFCIALSFARSPMGVFEVIGQLYKRFVRAFMIAAERRWVDVSESQTRLDPLLS